jgi:CheY-like chemotaxis protein
MEMKRIGVSRRAGEEKDAARSAAQERILYVEDDDSNWHVAQARLGRSYQLLRASSAPEACRLLESVGSELAVILMDIELRNSELDGLMLTKLIRGRLEQVNIPPYARRVPVLDTPVIFVTAHGAEYPQAALFSAGGQRVLAKPVDFSALTLAITQFHLAKLGRRTTRT